MENTLGNRVDLAEIPIVFILGGKGTRLGLGDRPKALVDVGDRPLLQLSLEKLAAQGCRKFLFLCGYLGDAIRDHFADGSKWDVEINYRFESTPLGTAGAVKAAADLLRSPFLVFYGDILFDIDVAKFAGFAHQSGGLGTLYTHPNDHPFDSDLVEVDENAVVTCFHAKPHNGAGLQNLVNAAIYYLTPAVLEFVQNDKLLDWGRDIFPDLVASGGRLHSYRGTEYVKDIGTPDRLQSALVAWRRGLVERKSYLRPQRAVFLDRDGVINAEIDGVYRPEDLVLTAGAAEAIALLNKSEFLAVCVTNQPGLAKGFFTVDALSQVHARLDEFLARGGAYLDDLYYCPHHPEKGFAGEVEALKRECDCRKPNSGMLVAAAAAHNIDLESSFIIGDRPSDLSAGAKVGVRGVFIRGSSVLSRDKIENALFSSTGLLQAVQRLLSENCRDGGETC